MTHLVLPMFYIACLILVAVRIRESFHELSEGRDESLNSRLPGMLWASNPRIPLNDKGTEIKLDIRLSPITLCIANAFHRAECIRQVLNTVGKQPISGSRRWNRPAERAITVLLNPVAISIQSVMQRNCYQSKTSTLQCNKYLESSPVCSVFSTRDSPSARLAPGSAVEPPVGSGRVWWDQPSSLWRKIRQYTDKHCIT